MMLCSSPYNLYFATFSDSNLIYFFFLYKDGLLDIALFDEESPVLYECTPLCSCWSYCPNRVAQKGIQYPLQIFKTKTKGVRL